MKKLLYSILVIFFSLNFTSYVYADCAAEEINSLKKEAQKIKVTYKHIEEYEVADGYLFYNRFMLNFKNLSSDNSIMYNDRIWNVENGNTNILFEWTSGKYYFYVYSNKCNTKLLRLDIVVPYFNEYSLDPLCEGIDGNDFSLCSKYKNGDSYISYETFKEKVSRYKEEHKTNEINNAEKQSNVFDDLIYFIIKNKYYFVAIISFFLIIIFITFLLKKRKRRGVLK